MNHISTYTCLHISFREIYDLGDIHTHTYPHNKHFRFLFSRNPYRSFRLERRPLHEGLRESFQLSTESTHVRRSSCKVSNCFSAIKFLYPSDNLGFISPIIFIYYILRLNVGWVLGEGVNKIHRYLKASLWHSRKKK